MMVIQLIWFMEGMTGLSYLMNCHSGPADSRVTELLNKQRRELELLSLSIEMETMELELRMKQEAMEMELREKQEALDLLKAKRLSLMDPADLEKEQRMLQSAEFHSVSLPQAVQKISASVVDADPGMKQESSPEATISLLSVEMVPPLGTTMDTPTTSYHRQVELNSVSSQLPGLQHMDILGLEVDGSPSGRRGRPRMEVSCPLVLVLLWLMVWKVCQVLISHMVLRKWKMVSQRVK
jgi:hypothetical protein